MEQKHQSYIWSIIGNLVALYIVRHLVDWHIPFILETFTSCVPIISFSIVATIIGDGILYITDPPWLRSFVKSLVTIVGIVSIYVVYSVFPFDFSLLGFGSIVEVCIKIAMIMGVIAAGIGVIVECIRGIYHLFT